MSSLYYWVYAPDDGCIGAWSIADSLRAARAILREGHSHFCLLPEDGDELADVIAYPPFTVADLGVTCPPQAGHSHWSRSRDGVCESYILRDGVFVVTETAHYITCQTGYSKYLTVTEGGL
jgi:hypothetical protein